MGTPEHEPAARPAPVDGDRTLRDQLHAARQALRGREEQLHRALEVRDELVGAISHEMRTPLTVVTGLSEVLANHADRLDAASLRHFADRINHHATRLEHMVDDLLAAARRDSLHPDRRPVEVRGVVEMARRDLELDDVQVIGRPDVVAHVDGQHLVRVVSELLSNATTYGRPPITVTIGQRDQTVTIAVRDHGEGVRPELRSRVFEPFTQRDTGDRRTVRGMGMGLHVARAIVRANDGELSLVDADGGPGGGACFLVELPVSVHAPGRARRPEWPIDDEAFRLFSVLSEPVIVHDGRTIRYANARFLELLGMTSPAQVVGRAAEDLVADPQALVDALEVLAETPPDGPPPTIRLPLRHVDGHAVWMATTRRTTRVGSSEWVVVHAQPTVAPSPTRTVLEAMGEENEDLWAHARAVLTACNRSLGTELAMVGRIVDGLCRVEQVEPSIPALPAGGTWPLPATLCGTVWTVPEGCLVTVPEVARSSWADHPARQVLGVGAFTAAPILADGRPWGTLLLAQRSAAPHWDDGPGQVALLTASWLGGRMSQR